MTKRLSDQLSLVLPLMLVVAEVEPMLLDAEVVALEDGVVELVLDGLDMLRRLAPDVEESVAEVCAEAVIAPSKQAIVAALRAGRRRKGR